MDVKRYLTQRGAEAFARVLKARFPHKLFQISETIGADFRTRYHVEVFIESGDKAYWVGCGPLSRKR